MKITDQHKCKNHKQKPSQANLTIYKNNYASPQMGCIPGVQG